MLCRICQTPIGSGKSAAKRIEERVAPDGLSDFYGYGLDQPLKDATGPLKAVYHPRCYYAAYKRQTKFGDAVTGNISGRTTTEILESGDAITGTVTMTSGMPEERERLKAEHLGGGQPYPHTHMGAVVGMTIAAHMAHAHGWELPAATLAELQVAHRELHAKAAADAIRARRLADPDDVRVESNWRDDVEAEI